VHIVTELQILAEGQRLVHGNVSKSFEHHHRDGATRLEISDDKLAEDVDADLDASKSLDHASRYCPPCCNAHGEGDRVPCLRWGYEVSEMFTHRGGA
jgi:hypothetical protein